VKCSHVYEDNEDAVMHGCSCGAKAFFFLKCNHKELPQITEVVQTDGAEESEIESGKYDLDLHTLFGRKTLVHQNDEGKYDIDLEESFKQHAGK
jgi:predicted  nucleic acid-binding Zn-ribbon protein